MSDWRDFLDLFRWSATINLVSFFRLSLRLSSSCPLHIDACSYPEIPVCFQLGLSCCTLHRVFFSLCHLDGHFVKANVDLSSPCPASFTQLDRLSQARTQRVDMAAFLSNMCDPFVSFQPRDCCRLCGLGGNGKPCPSK